MSYHWFGDSWVRGDEIDLISDDFSNYTFANLVTKHFDQQCYIHAVDASSILHLLIQFRNAEVEPNDICFFGLTSLDRMCIIGNDKEYHLYLTAVLHKDSRIDHAMMEAWYKYFDSTNNRKFIAEIVVDLLISLCKEKKAKAYFYNTFTKNNLTTTLTNSQDWLVDSTTCVAESILHVFDDVNGTVIVDDCSSITEQEWSIQKPLVEKYIHPNFVHPNFAGHRKIADYLIEKLYENTK
jgi:hypothetical protein